MRLSVASPSTALYTSNWCAAAAAICGWWVTTAPVAPHGGARIRATAEITLGGKVVPDGEYGEIVFTSLTREAMPIIRYRTHDITRILSREKCACGRTSLRIDRITGRTDDMLIVKGVNFYPRQVEQALKEIPGVADEFQIILEEKNGMTDVTVNVEAEPGVTGHTVAKHLRERLGFLPKGDVFPIGTLPRTEGKAKRVIKRTADGSSTTTPSTKH